MILHIIVTLKEAKRKWYDSNVHRVNTKDKRVIALRIAAYIATVVLSIITTTLLLFVALGYRFNSQDGIIQSGLLLIDNKPEAGAIYIDGELNDNQTPGRFVLPVSTYEVSLERDGYRGWKKNFSIKAEVVERVDYPLLIPKELSTNTLAAIGTPAMVSQSLDNKQLVSFVDGESVLRRTVLDPATPETTDVSLSSAFARQAGSIGSLRVIEWSLDNNFILVEQSLPGGQKNIISLELDKPGEAVNLTKLFSAISLGDPHYVGGETDEIYALSDANLRRLNIKSAEATVVLEQVKSYVPYGDKTIAFSRLSDDSLTLEAGLLRDSTSTVLQRYTDTQSNIMVTYGQYDGHDYFVSSDKKAVNIYRDPLKRPILATQIPFVSLPFDSAQYIKFSPNSQFILLQSGKNYITYDLEHKRQSTFTIEQDIIGLHPRWMNDSHLSYQTTDGVNYLTEFDNQNSNKMVVSDVGTRLYYAANQRGAYRIVTGANGTQLELVSLTAE